MEQAKFTDYPYSKSFEKQRKAIKQLNIKEKTNKSH